MQPSKAFKVVGDCEKGGEPSVFQQLIDMIQVEEPHQQWFAERVYSNNLLRSGKPIELVIAVYIPHG